MNITISGASGLIGRRLLKLLAKDGHSLTALSRHAGTNLPPGVRLSVWDAARGEPSLDGIRDADAVIHLAGVPVAQRWNARVKNDIRESRVAGTRNLVQALSRLPDEARAAETAGIRVVRMRTGIVLDARGGALPRMLRPFKMGVGGKLGSGKHWMSWIHLDDLVALFQYALANPVSGPINGVAPNPVTNAEFTKALAAAVHRPAIFPVPAFALRLLFGEMGGILLASQRVAPKAAQSAGFTFRFPELAPALAEALKG